ncbi:MAG: glycosyltransferase family 39 protein [Acidobacteria bacterium]|nr:glycosyltransferase family 39 protein [Acidobacteriota bacterium]
MIPDNSNHPEKAAGRHREILALMLLTVVALALRAYRLDAVGLSEDEAHKAQAAQSYRAGDFKVNAEHPMLMKMLITGSMIAAETWNGAVASTRPHLTISEETAIRLPNALFGALTTVVLFLLARKLFGPMTGWLTAALWATGINAIAWNRIAKEDTLLVFFTWLGFYFYFKAKHEGPVDTARRDRFYKLSGASFGLMLASKYFPHYLGLNFLYHFSRPHDPQSNSPLGKRALALLFLAFFLTFALANPVVFHTDTLRYMLVYASEKTLTHHGYEMMGHLYYNTPWTFTNHTPIYFYLLYVAVKTPPVLLLAFLIGLALVLRGPKQEGVFFLRFMLVLWIVPYSLFNAKWLRYTLSALPMVYMTAALGLAAVYRKLQSLPWSRPARLVPAIAVLAIFLLAPAWTALSQIPYPLLYVNMLGGGESRRAYYFPHDEIYEAGIREAMAFIAQQAARGSVVAHQDSPGLVEVYSRRFQRPDLVAVGLSGPPLASGQISAITPVYIIAQKGLRYFENQAELDYLEQHYRPVKEIWVDGVRTTQIYEMAWRP